MSLIVSTSTYRKLTTILYYIVVLLFVSAIALVFIYQAGYLLSVNPHMPFLEADNYEYYLFAQLAIAHPGSTPLNLTNPYLVGGPPGFFEHPGLYLMPVYAYDLLHLPLVWEFRILQALAVFIIYLFSLLLVRKIINALPVDRIYHWLAYTIVLTSFLLMQYTEVVEWRGNEFVTAISLVILYAFAWFYTHKNVRSAYTIFTWFLITGLSILAIWIWSVGGVIAVPLVTALLFGFTLYDLVLSKHVKIWRYVALAGVLGAVALFFFSGPIEDMLSSVTVSYNFSGCLSNPLHIGELDCLNISNGLVAILMMIVFGTFAVAAFLGDTIMSNKRKEYEYYLFGVFIAGLLFLPLSLIYIRLIGVIAPYLTIMYALGIVAMLSYFSKSGSNRIVLSLTVILVLISSFVGQYIFYISSDALYGFTNPDGLAYATAYMSNSSPNATVLTYYAYGGYLEAYGHLRVYADTIQGLNYKDIGRDDTFFSSNSTTACAMLKNYTPQPYFIMTSDNMLNSTLFANVSNDSILKDTQSFNDSCGYTIRYEQGGFTVFAHR